MMTERLEPTKTQRLKQEHDAIRERLDAELLAQAKAEFPIGAVVKWIYTFKHSRADNASTPVWRRGTVWKHSDFQFTMKMLTGGLHDRYPQDLYHVDAT